MMEKFQRYMESWQKIRLMHDEMKAMEEDVVKELQGLGFTADAISRMMGVTKCRALLSVRKKYRKNDSNLSGGLPVCAARPDKTGKMGG